jgi:hypothetical protein
MASVSRSRSKLDDADDAYSIVDEYGDEFVVSGRQFFGISVVMYQHPTRSVNYGEQV